MKTLKLINFTTPAVITTDLDKLLLGILYQEHKTPLNEEKQSQIQRALYILSTNPSLASTTLNSFIRHIIDMIQGISGTSDYYPGSIKGITLYNLDVLIPLLARSNFLYKLVTELAILETRFRFKPRRLDRLWGLFSNGKYQAENAFLNLIEKILIHVRSEESEYVIETLSKILLNQKGFIDYSKLGLTKREQMARYYVEQLYTKKLSRKQKKKAQQYIFRDIETLANLLQDPVIGMGTTNEDDPEKLKYYDPLNSEFMNGFTKFYTLLLKDQPNLKSDPNYFADLQQRILKAEIPSKILHKMYQLFYELSVKWKKAPLFIIRGEFFTPIWANAYTPTTLEFFSKKLSKDSDPDRLPLYRLKENFVFALERQLEFQKQHRLQNEIHLKSKGKDPVPIQNNLSSKTYDPILMDSLALSQFLYVFKEIETNFKDKSEAFYDNLLETHEVNFYNLIENTHQRDLEMLFTSMPPYALRKIFKSLADKNNVLERLRVILLLEKHLAIHEGALLSVQNWIDHSDKFIDILEELIRLSEAHEGSIHTIYHEYFIHSLKSMDAEINNERNFYSSEKRENLIIQLNTLLNKVTDPIYQEILYQGVKSLIVVEGKIAPGWKYECVRSNLFFHSKNLPGYLDDLFKQRGFKDGLQTKIDGILKNNVKYTENKPLAKALVRIQTLARKYPNFFAKYQKPLDLSGLEIPPFSSLEDAYYFAKEIKDLNPSQSMLKKWLNHQKTGDFTSEYVMTTGVIPDVYLPFLEAYLLKEPPSVLLNHLEQFKLLTETEELITRIDYPDPSLFKILSSLKSEAMTLFKETNILDTKTILNWFYKDEIIEDGDNEYPYFKFIANTIYKDGAKAWNTLLSLGLNHDQILNGLYHYFETPILNKLNIPMRQKLEEFLGKKFQLEKVSPDLVHQIVDVITTNKNSNQNLIILKDLLLPYYLLEDNTLDFYIDSSSIFKQDRLQVIQDVLISQGNYTLLTSNLLAYVDQQTSLEFVFQDQEYLINILKALHNVSGLLKDPYFITNYLNEITQTSSDPLYAQFALSIYHKLSRAPKFKLPLNDPISDKSDKENKPPLESLYQKIRYVVDSLKNYFPNPNIDQYLKDIINPKIESINKFIEHDPEMKLINVEFMIQTDSQLNSFVFDSSKAQPSQITKEYMLLRESFENIQSILQEAKGYQHYFVYEKIKDCLWKYERLYVYNTPEKIFRKPEYNPKPFSSILKGEQPLLGQVFQKMQIEKTTKEHFENPDHIKLITDPKNNSKSFIIPWSRGLRWARNATAGIILLISADQLDLIPEVSNFQKFKDWITKIIPSDGSFGYHEDSQNSPGSFSGSQSVWEIIDKEMKNPRIKLSHPLHGDHQYFTGGIYIHFDPEKAEWVSSTTEEFEQNFKKWIKPEYFIRFSPEGDSSVEVEYVKGPEDIENLIKPPGSKIIASINETGFIFTEDKFNIIDDQEIFLSPREEVKEDIKSYFLNLYDPNNAQVDVKPIVNYPEKLKDYFEGETYEALTKPTVPWDKLPPQAQDMILEAKAMPLDIAMNHIKAFMFKYYRYSFDFQNSPEYEEFYDNLGSHPASTNALFEAIHRYGKTLKDSNILGMGVCKDLSEVMLEYFRHAKIPAVPATGNRTREDVVITSFGHRWVFALVPNKQDQIQMAVAESTEVPFFTEKEIELDDRSWLDDLSDAIDYLFENYSQTLLNILLGMGTFVLARNLWRVSKQPTQDISNPKLNQNLNPDKNPEHDKNPEPSNDINTKSAPVTVEKNKEIPTKTDSKQSTTSTVQLKRIRNLLSLSLYAGLPKHNTDVFQNLLNRFEKHLSKNESTEIESELKSTIAQLLTSLGKDQNLTQQFLKALEGDDIEKIAKELIGITLEDSGEEATLELKEDLSDKESDNPVSEDPKLSQSPSTDPLPATPIEKKPAWDINYYLQKSLSLIMYGFSVYFIGNGIYSGINTEISKIPEAPPQKPDTEIKFDLTESYQYKEPLSESELQAEWESFEQETKEIKQEMSQWFESSVELINKHTRWENYPKSMQEIFNNQGEWIPDNKKLDTLASEKDPLIKRQATLLHQSGTAHFVSTLFQSKNSKIKLFEKEVLSQYPELKDIYKTFVTYQKRVQSLLKRIYAGLSFHNNLEGQKNNNIPYKYYLSFLEVAKFSWDKEFFEEYLSDHGYLIKVKTKDGEEKTQYPYKEVFEAINSLNLVKYLDQKFIVHATGE